MIASAANNAESDWRSGRTAGVLDASVASKWFIPEQSTVDSEALLRQITTSNPHIVVPEIFFAEVVSAVGKQCRNGSTLERCAESLARLPLERVCWVSVPVRRCVELIQRRVGAYDAIYAALAIERRLPLLTADARLARALGEPDWVVLLR